MRMNKNETIRFYYKVDSLMKLSDYKKDTLTVIQDVERLYSIETQLAKIAERECCEPMTERQAKWNESRTENLTNEAQLLAKNYGCVFYRQTDPRGCQVYLVPAHKIPEGEGYEWIDSHYSSYGLAFCK